MRLSSSLVVGLTCAAISASAACVAATITVRSGKEARLFLPEAAPRVDAILVLGARLRADGQPSAMLNDRLITTAQVWHRYAAEQPTSEAPRVIITGTDGRDGQIAETGVMQRVMDDCGVPPRYVTVDPAGISTRRSAVNLGRDTACIAVVSQRFHLPRALFNIDHARSREGSQPVIGIIADRRSYATARKAAFREVFASVKDVALAIIS